METVLKRLNLGGLTEKFETERITPDLVCKLSVREMEMLGVTSRGDMMSANRMHKIWRRSTEENRGSLWCPHLLYSKVGAWQFNTRRIYNQGNFYDPCRIREYNLPEDEAVRTEQVRVY